MVPQKIWKFSDRKSGEGRWTSLSALFDFRGASVFVLLVLLFLFVLILLLLRVLVLFFVLVLLLILVLLVFALILVLAVLVIHTILQTAEPQRNFARAGVRFGYGDSMERFSRFYAAGKQKFALDTPFTKQGTAGSYRASARSAHG